MQLIERAEIAVSFPYTHDPSRKIVRNLLISKKFFDTSTGADVTLQRVFYTPFMLHSTCSGVPPMKLSHMLPLFAVLAILMPLSASALSFTGDSLHGSTGELTIVDNGGGSSTVTWSLDTTNFDDADAIATDHTFLTDVAFKISGMTSVMLAPISSTAGVLYYSSNVNQATDGCDKDGSPAGFACLSLTNPVLATDNQTISYSFIVGGDLDLSEGVSFRGKYGLDTGWIISEKNASAPVPEPSAALLFMAGILAVGRRSIRS